VSALATIDDLRRRGIAVEVQGPDLVLNGPPDILTDELVASLRAAKAELLLAAECKNASGWDLEDWWAYFCERAAIREYTGGMSRADADRCALADVLMQWLSRRPTPPIVG
jgi:hypothetical protein